MLAVIDETTPFVAGGICYGLISAILLGDKAETEEALRAVLPATRTRPFHWSEEGPVARERMIDVIEKVGVLGHAVVVPCSRQRQESARSVALTASADRLLDDGCDELIIESRTSAQDVRDRATVLRCLERRGSHNLSYRWDRKTNELLWIADAIGGVVHDHLVGQRANLFEGMRRATGLAITYESLP